MNRHWLLVFFIMLFASSLSFAQNTSNKGKDFYVPYAGHIDGNNSRLSLFLSADQSTDYAVYIGNTLISPVGATIPANTCLPFVIDPNVYNVLMSGSDVSEPNKAIHVVTGKAISLYSIISNNARTGGTLVLPTNTLGQEYYTFSYENQGNQQGFSQFTIVATVDGTQVEIKPKQNERNGRKTANTTFTVNLNKGDIYQYQSASDLTGSHIKALNCSPIAVFTGNTWAAFCNAGNSRSPSGGDNLYQQVFPVSSWGKNFVTAPFYNTLHGNTDIMRVIVAEDNTVVTVNGSTTDANGTSLANPYNKGAVVTFFSTRANVISGSKPISVAQYQTSQTCNPNNAADTRQGGPYLGDPEITVLNPVEQTLNNITVFSDLKSVVPDRTQISKYFLNVILKTVDIASFRLDGRPVSGFVNIDNVFSYAIIDVTDTQPQHRLSAAGGFSAISYGYGSVESYAYLAGANIQNFTFQPSSTATGQPITSGCLGEPISLTINLPYQATKLDWEIQGAARFTDNNPVAIGTFTRANDINTYYTYKYPNDLNYPTPGDYQFKVIATKPNADNCGNTEELIIDFSVDNQPTAAFKPVLTGCQATGVQFTDESKSNSDSRSITKWLWDFGDGKTSTEQNPVHIFDNPGTYNVVLTAETDSKCADVSDAIQIVINPQPQSSFNVRGLCVGLDLILTENSTIQAGSIVKWVWNFGDGSGDIVLDNKVPPVHHYTAIGNYTISLTTESDLGCLSEPQKKNVAVINPQLAAFEIPDFCLEDGIARFKNTSKNADGTTTGLTAVWQYDTNNPLATSTGFDGAFAYTATGTYTVTLMVKNQDGCQMHTSRTFTVNGSVKAADFEIKNNNSCASEEIIINNTSTTFAGNITKIEVYRDYGREATIYKTITYPDASDIAIKYDTFGGASNRTFTIRLVAYSGESCIKFVDKTVTLKPVPQLVFENMESVCEADGTVLITQGKQKVGEEMNGLGVYSGLGIQSDGTFNPKIAGVGQHTITYTFTGENGCTNLITNTIEVYKSPVADAGTLIYVLAGGQIELPATAEGKNLKYGWMPAKGLNRTDILNPIASPDEDTEYTLTATTLPDGCATTSKVLVKVLQVLTPPNTFTPNGDNVNDVWIIKYLESYPNATVEIFNRNGNRVFFSNGYKIPFDGNYQNEPLPVGVYYYIINPRNGRKSITGPLTIIR
ncbi:PKD domain-containing protein [Pedobacter sp. GSP4]|uniref:PKD domain-containing protein n=1 Tax=Pedobacter sp. GSP4 TaxID=3453716 RepID=UPI003EEE8232